MKTFLAILGIVTALGASPAVAQEAGAAGPVQGLTLQGTDVTAQEPAASAHPRLFFGPEEVEEIRARAYGMMRPQFDAVLAYADQHLADAPPPLAGDYEARGLAIEHPYLTSILDFSFAHVVTGEEKYLAAAKRWMLALASMEMWAGPASPSDKEADRGLYAGFGLTALACGYDWLYEDLSDEERAAVRARMATVAEGIYRATYGGEWWSGAYLHHDHWIPVAGMGLAALSIYDEARDAERWAAQAEAEFAQALNRLGEEGAWHEGVCGWAFGMASFAPFWDAYGRHAGTKLDERGWLKSTWTYRLYSRVPSGEFLTFGDGRATGAYQWTAWQAAPALRLLASKYANRHAQWLAEREWEARPNPYTAVWEIIWADTELDGLAPQPLPRAALFKNQGLAILRTGWEDDATVAALRCDSVVGQLGAFYYQQGDDRINVGVDHAHADANSFAVWARGAFSIAPPGYGQRETEFQNTLLVDGQGQYRFFDRVSHPGRPAGSVTRFFPGRFASFVTGEAAQCYPAGLKSYERTMYLVEPGIVFLVDKVSADRPVTFEWLFHADKAAQVTPAPGGFLSMLGNRLTTVRFATAQALKFRVTEDRYNRRFTISPQKKASEARLVTAILPSVDPGDKPSVTSPAEGVIRVKALGVEVMAAFPAGPGGISAGALTSDGSCAIATIEGTRRGFMAADAMRLDVGGESLLASAVPVTVSCYADESSGRMTISSPETTQVAVNPRMPVRDVVLGPGRSVPYITDGPRIILNVPEGTRTYELIRGDAPAIPGN